MDERETDSQRGDVVEDQALLPPPKRERPPRPMWGCARVLAIAALVVIAILILSTWGLYYYTGTTNFAELVRLKVEKNLEFHLGRDVSIGKVTVVRGRQSRIIIDDIRVANAPGASRPYFAMVRQVEIRGGVDSFWRRHITLGRVDVRDPRINFEVFPESAQLEHNFPHWKSSKPGRFEITRVDVTKLFVTGGAFEFLDRRHDLRALASNLSSEVTPLMRQGIYQGTATSPSLVMRIQDYEPIQATLRGGFYYRPGSLALNSIAIRGTGIEMFVAGKIEPITENVYDLTVRGRTDLARVRQIFRVEKKLGGSVAIDTTLRGKAGQFVLAGRFAAPKIEADVYDLADARGTLRVDSEKTTIQIARAGYGGGTLSGDYLLSKYGEPYPMSIDLRFDRVSVEKLFSDWGVQDTGLRGAANGTLAYSWNKDKLLEGRGNGAATLRPGAIAFGNAKYPVAVGGKTRFALNRGVITFAPSVLDTEKSHVEFAGTMRIEDLSSNLDVNISSRDFTELDRVAYNFARSAGKKDYTLLGLGGTGTITGNVKGTLKEPDVVAQIVSDGTQYNGSQLGHADIDLAYAGKKSILTFDRATFTEGQGTLTMAGTIAFPDRGPSPQFDLDITANDYPVEKALAVVKLDLKAGGSGTGRLHVSGTPDNGDVRFDRMEIVDRNGRLHLNGLIAWAPGKGNVRFDLDVGAESYPVQAIVAFLDLGPVQATGDVTGTLHLTGTKTNLEGAGSVTLLHGTLYGEPIARATADLLFSQGRMRATHAEVVAPAGTITGEAEVDFNKETFSYIVRGAELDLSKVKMLSGLANVLNGRVTLSSSGAGPFARPELVLDATMDQAMLQGRELPPGTPPPTLYVAIRDGRLIIKGSAFNAATLEGEGSVLPDGRLDGAARLTISDLQQFMNLFFGRADLQASGNIVADFRLGGKLSPIEALRVEGSVPVFNVTISDHTFAPSGPLLFAVENGRFVFRSFNLKSDDSILSLAGYVGLTGDKPINLDVNGLVETALIRLFAPDIKAEGHVNVTASIRGTVTAPQMRGAGEIQNAQLKIAGFPQLIDDIRGTILFRGDRLEIDSLRATIGGGTVTAGGFITVEGLTPKRVRLNIQGTDVALRYFEGVTVDGDFSLILSGDADRMILQGDVSVDRATYYRDFDLTTSILNLLLERRGLLPQVAASWQDHVSLRIHLTSKDTLSVENNIAKVTGSADLDLTGTLANPVILGLVSIDEGGKVRFQDVDYRVVRGTINFQNPFRIDPYFDITAEGRLQEYQLSINLTGTLEHITPQISSDPPISDLTLLSLFGLGGNGLGNGVATGQMTPGGFSTAGTSLLVQSIGGFLGQKILPFADAVRVDPGLIEGSSRSGPTVTFEKRISNQLRVIIIYNTRDSQKNQEIIEWQATPDWVIVLTRDEESPKTYLVNAVDARFRRRYEGHW